MDRNTEILRAFEAGQTKPEIGRKFGISHERVRQIIEKMAPGTFGGMSKRSKDRKDKIKAEWEAKRGMTRSAYKELQAIGKRMEADGYLRGRTPIGAYAVQKCNARKRGIGFHLTLGEWWSVWKRSGKWDERGLDGNGYVMCRCGDEGPYEIGNVYIATNSQNMRDYHSIALPARKAKLEFDYDLHSC